MIINIDNYFLQANDTPLHWAAYEGHFDVADVLIKSGALLDAINNVSVFIIKHVVIIHDCILYVMFLLIYVIM